MGTWCTEGVKRTKLEYQRIESTKRRRITIAHQAERIEQLQAELEQQADFLSLAKEQMDAYQAELDKHRWIPVTERLPKEGYLWFCYEKTGYTYDGYYQPQYKLWEMFDPCGGYSKIDVGSPPTHWKEIILPDQALQNTNTDGATGGGRDAPLKEAKKCIEE